MGSNGKPSRTAGHATISERSFADVNGVHLVNRSTTSARTRSSCSDTALQRRDGESVYSVHGSTRYTSEALILAVEDRLLAANAAQVELARSFVCDDRLMVAGVGPAGGKTTAMQLTAAALNLDGRALVAVAPSARAAGPVPVPSGQAVVDVGPVGLRLSDILLKA